MYSLQAKLLLS